MDEEERKIQSLLAYTFDRMAEELGGSRGHKKRPPHRDPKQRGKEHHDEEREEEGTAPP